MMFVPFVSFLARITLCFICVPGLLHSSECSAVIVDGEYLNISLANYNVTFEAGRVIKDTKELLPFSTINLNVIKIPETVRFIIVQAHAFLYNITLSYNAVLNPHSFINGTNLGLVQLIDRNQSTAEFYIQNPNPIPNVSVLITVQGYGEEDPIPGGCNMEFSVEIAPYLITSFTESVIIVDSQPASAPVPRDRAPVVCESQQVHHEMYHMFLTERDFTCDSYFGALLKMMTVQDVQSNGKKVSEPVEGSQMRRIYSAYPGTGSVYAVIARSGISATAYVPSLTYACSALYWTDSCDVLSEFLRSVLNEVHYELSGTSSSLGFDCHRDVLVPDTTFSGVLCAVIFFLGLFVSLFGHQFFKTEIFLLGFLSGGLISYIILAVFSTCSSSVIMVLSVLLGLCFGALWLGFWWCYGIPVCSVLLATLTLGFVVAAVAAYGWLGDVDVLRTDFNFWMVFACIVLLVPVVFLSLIQKANMISCAVLGAYAVIIPIDHYIGSNLKYIIVNVVRRATVGDFRMAIVDPPFQVKDAVLCAIWIAHAIIGVAIQWYKQRGKPPFPPPPNMRLRIPFRRRRFVCAATAATERTPLLPDAGIPPVRIPYITTSDGNDDVFESPEHSSSNFSFFKRWQQSA